MRYKVDSILSYVPRVQGILPETSEGWRYSLNCREINLQR
jgi:hypothetical protein